MIAHIAGLPLEETLPSVTGIGVGPLLAGAWIMLRRLRRRPPPR